MPQDRIGSWSQRKSKALNPHMAEALKNLREWSTVSRQKDFAEHSDDCSYLLRICFNYGTNVSVLQSWIPLQVVDCKHGVFWFANKQVQITKLSILKLVSLESLAGNDFSEWGTQAKAQRNRNLNCQLWRKVGSRCFIEGLIIRLSFCFTLPAEMLFTKWNESRAWSQVSGPITWGLGALVSVYIFILFHLNLIILVECL